MAIDSNPYGLTPEAAAELAAFNLEDYQKSFLGRQGLISSRDDAALAAARATGASNVDMYVNDIGYDEIIPGSTANIMAGIGLYNPNYRAVMRTYGSENDSSNPQDVTERSTFAVDPNAAYRLVDNKTGEVIAEASNLNDVRGLVDMANSVTEDQGKNADWSLEAGRQFPTGDKANPMETRWDAVARDEPSKMMDGALGAVMDIALPVLLSAVVPGAGFLGTMLPAAGGAAASSALQQRSLKETLIRSALAGATAGIGEKFITPALNSVLNPVANAGSEVASEVVSDIAANAAANAAGQGVSDIIVTAIPQLVSGLGSGLSSALSSGIGSALSNAASSYTPPSSTAAPQQPVAEPVVEPVIEPGELVVNAIRNPALNTAVSGIAGAIPKFVADNYGTYEPQEPVTRENPDTGEDEIVVTAQNQPVLLPSVAEALINQTLPEFTQTPEIVDPGRSVGDYLRDASKVAALIPLVGKAADAILGGGGGGTSGIGGASGPGVVFNPIRLTPTVTPESVRANGGRYPYTPATYGRMGGDQETEYTFFNRAPTTAPVTVPVTAQNRKEGGEMHDDMVKHLVEYQKGGGHQGPGKVTGIGSGQEDLIPAWLSDGEYVWSAQDVADLGDGSTDAGVRRLDKMRQMVRQQAGRKDVKKIAKPQKGIDTMLKAVGGQA